MTIQSTQIRWMNIPVFSYIYPINAHVVVPIEILLGINKLIIIARAKQTNKKLCATFISICCLIRFIISTCVRSVRRTIVLIGSGRIFDSVTWYSLDRCVGHSFVSSANPINNRDAFSLTKWKMHCVDCAALHLIQWIHLESNHPVIVHNVIFQNSRSDIFWSFLVSRFVCRGLFVMRNLFHNGSLRLYAFHWIRFHFIVVALAVLDCCQLADAHDSTRIPFYAILFGPRR